MSMTQKAAASEAVSAWRKKQDVELEKEPAALEVHSFQYYSGEQESNFQMKDWGRVGFVRRKIATESQLFCIWDGTPLAM